MLVFEATSWKIASSLATLLVEITKQVSFLIYGKIVHKFACLIYNFSNGCQVDADRMVWGGCSDECKTSLLFTISSASWIWLLLFVGGGRGSGRWSMKQLAKLKKKNFPPSLNFFFIWFPLHVLQQLHL